MQSLPIIGDETAVQTRGRTRGFDVLELPVVGAFLKWHGSRRTMQAVMLVVAVVMIVHGFLGPQLAPRNLATLLTWVHYRGLLVLALLVAGNLFCMACPFILVRDLARRFARPVLHWPARLRSKWLAVGLFVAVLFSYEYFDLWGSPLWTAWLIVAYFAAALLIDSFFTNASFCKYVCPVGQFNFVGSTVSPLEVSVRDHDVCASCTTLDCIKGTRAAHEPSLVLQRGCELALFQPKKEGNMDCTFCLDCVYACPHDNIGIHARLPGSELFGDPRRSGVGRFSRRPDLAALALLFTFGALLNAFGMVSPVYAVQEWLAGLLGTTSELPVLATLFAVALVVEPAVLIGGAAYATKLAAGTSDRLSGIVVRFAYALIPLGFGIWLSHYSFHFLTGIWTVVPVIQQMLLDASITVFGLPAWHLTGVPQELVLPLELGFLGLGAVGTLLTAYRIAEREYPEQAARAFVPWAILSLMLLAAAVWLLYQPMEMRGTFLGS